MIPRATYRLQFHKGFTFSDAARQADYFAALGISHIYASPILTARAGSLHGYDVVDHRHINPELGGESALRALVLALKTRGLGMIVDIVPNHMAVGQADNDWWLDLLQKGRASAHAAAFDIDWDAPGLEGKVLAPFLDGAPQAVWEKGDLTVMRDPALNRWAFAYFGHRFPLRPEDQQLARAPTGWADAAQLLARQHFVLADWREADRRINWRRFFDITELAALRIAEPAVFDAVHGKILDLYAEGLIDGVRVDHVDGIADPAAYCRLLHRRLSALRPDPYLVVEKILADGEPLPPDWGIDGTTGYDVMNDISALQHGDDGGALEALWQETGGNGRTFEDEETTARREILSSKFAAQCDAAARAFCHLLPGVPQQTVRHEIEAAIVALRCYRGYVTGKPDSPEPGAILARALEQAPRLRPLFADRSGDPAVAEALRRFHQLSAPVAAKAVEDTAFYRYGRLLSRNDVGFDPRRRFLRPVDFHARVQARARDFPHAMLTTATHDHKRGEDSRARLAVLSARPELWTAFVRQAPQDDRVHPADSYMLLQTLLGAWSGGPEADFAARIEGWCRKYLREAKLRSSWQDPDLDYEETFCAFARDLVTGPERAGFRAWMADLLTAIAPLADRNMLVQAALRLTLPGVPDIYQGTEFLDLSLVDPDNRRPVDYAARARALAGSVTARSPLGHRKQWLIAILLAARRARPDLWRKGTYEPIAAGDGVIAFVRRHGWQRLCLVARCDGQEDPAAGITLEKAGRDLLTGRDFAAAAIPVATLLERWPVAVVLSAG